MDINQTRMKPPTGAGAGLPFTWCMDPLGNWAHSPLTPTSASGNLIQPSGENWAQQGLKNPEANYTSSSYTNSMSLINTEAPRLLITGNMMFGQGMPQSARAYNQTPNEKCNGIANITTTYTSPGRFTAHRDSSRTGEDSPGNYSYHNMIGGATLGMPVGDIVFGKLRTGASSYSSNDDGHITAVCTYSATDVSSGGWGRQWGDSHSTMFLVGVGASWIDDSDAQAMGYGQVVTRNGIAASGVPLYWTLNVAADEHWVDPLAAGGNPSSAVNRNASAYGERATIAHFAFKDAISTPGNPDATIRTVPLGSPTHGNSVVADSCGVVGYDGVMVATASFAVSSDSDTATSGSKFQFGYGSINLIVHTGVGPIRNPATLARFNSGQFMFDHGDMMSTNCGMMKGSTRTSYFANATTLLKGVTVANTGSTVGYYQIGKTGDKPGIVQAEYDVASVAANEQVTRIVGEVPSSGAWNGTTSLGLTFAADKLPTRVRIVPSLLGKDSSGNPIVDYHVLVSLADLATAPERNASADWMGDPTQRNDPSFRDYHFNVDVSNLPCEIWHGVFRLSPTTLPAGSAQCSPGCLKQPVSWGLHQVTPFRPLANQDWAQVPRLCNTVEPGGTFQRGGISHMWDADAYGSELFVGADLVDALDISGSTGNDENGHATFGEWGHGQVWDNTGPRVPGKELMLFRYSPSDDPWHPGTKVTSPTDNVLYDWLYNNAPLLANKSAQFNAAIHHASHSVSDTHLKSWKGWEIHDWVFPQKELMPYIGQGLPTIHCSSLRIMDDGRMLMAAIQRDYIGQNGSIPQLDIGWPYNPDVMFDMLPPGYYLDSAGVVQPFGTGVLYSRDDGSGNAFVPQAGTYVTGATIPSVSTSNPSSFSGQDTVFGYIPPWNKTVGSSHARSLILLWSDAKAKDGRVRRGRKDFSVKWEREGGNWSAVQNWIVDDTWWSGSQISYWYPESGQRGIPITYGCYPEARMSYAHLPRTTPYIDSSGIVRNGYPLVQPIHSVEPGHGCTIEQAMSDPTAGLSDVALNGWWKDHYDFLTIHRFVPTTIGFADFGPGTNPWMEFGWSGWSFPSGLYNPFPFVNSAAFTDHPTVTAPWSDFGHSTPTSPGSWMNGPQSAISHHGPLHWGMSENTHPFITDRVWKQVHAGMGYDIPIHLLTPGEVSVRARSGDRGSLDLEMETPFHITDGMHLQGLSDYYDRTSQTYASGTQIAPGQSRPSLGQFYLRTNLWAQPSQVTVSGTMPNVNEKIRGPRFHASGNFVAEMLAEFWQDHPTEHFHAGAIPLLPGSDIDYNDLEINRYPLPLLGRSDETHIIDALSQTEQLQSSVDVHVQKNVLPVWDSGGIVSGKMLGDGDSRFIGMNQQFASPIPISDVATPTVNAFEQQLSGTGYGQVVLRTPDGTLHQFVPEVSTGTKVGASFDACIRHYTKPVHSDLFWNRRANTSSYDPTNPTPLKDEVAMSSLSATATKFRGIASATDSTGRIHLAIEVWDSGKSQIWYTYADAKLEKYNPEVVWSWDWTIATPITMSTTNWIAQPTMAIDSNDIIHFSCVNVLGTPVSTTEIIYTQCSASDPIFSFTGTYGDAWFRVSKPDGSENSLLAPTRCNYAHAPRIHLSSNNTPCIVWGGYDYSTTQPGRNQHAVWANCAIGSQGFYRFDDTQSTVVVGMAPSGNWSMTDGKGVQYWDSCTDNNNIVHVVASIQPASGSPSGLIIEAVTFNYETTPLSQYDSANGTSPKVVVFHSTSPDTPNRNFQPDWEQFSITCDHNNAIHMVVSTVHHPSIVTSDANVEGETDRASSQYDKTAYPLDYPGDPSPDANAYDDATPDTNTGIFEGTIPNAISTTRSSHLIELWWPAYEVSNVFASPGGIILRSLNVRWLSVPGMSWDADSGWIPVSDATLGGTEDFPHRWPQLRQQTHHGFSRELDLIWKTDMLSVYLTDHEGSRLYFWQGGM